MPEMGAGRAWVLREMGSVWGRGVREGPAPTRTEGDKQSVLKEGRDSMDKEEEERASRAW